VSVDEGEKSKMMLGLNILPLLFGILMYQETSGQDILGCGGFIKSASPIDLTKIKVWSLLND